MAQHSRSRLKKAELGALREQAMAMAGIGITQYAADGTVLYADQRALEILDLKHKYADPAELCGLNIDDLLQYAEAPGSLRQGIVRHGGVAGGEYRFRTLSGKERHVRHDSCLVGDGETGEQVVQSIFRDITDEKATENALRESEERYRRLIEESLVPIVVIQDEKVVYANTALCELAGFTAEELIGQPQALRIHPDDRTLIMQRSADRLAGKSVPLRYELRVLCKDETVLWVELTASLCMYKGRPAIQTSFVDITERKLAEQRLRQTELRLATLFENLPDVVMYETGGGREYVSDNIRNITGVPAEQFMSDRTTFPGLMHPDDDAPMGDAIRQWNAAGSPGVLQMEFRCRRPDGEWGWLEDRMVRIRPAGERSYMAGVLVDITERKRTEQALAESRAELQRIADGVPVLLAHFDMGQRCLFANRGYAEWFGRSIEEIVGQQLQDILTERAYAAALPFLELAEQGIPVNYEAPGFGGPGGSFVQVSVNPHMDATGTVLGYYVVVSNITISKQAEEALRESEERYRRLVETAQEGIVTDDPDGRITFVNPAFATMLGYGADELLGRSIQSLCDEHNGTLLRRGTSQRQQGRITSYEVRLQCKDGTERDFNLTANPLLSREGQHEGALGIFTDITERKQAEEALRLSEQRLRQVIDLVPHFIFAKDIEGRFILVNEAIAEAYGTTVEELTGKTDADFAQSAAEARHFRSDDMEVIASGKSKVVPEETITDAQGNVRYLQTTKIPFTFSGLSAPSVLGVAVNISERKWAEEALRESEERYRYLIEHMSDGLAIVDPTEHFTFANPALEQIFGVPPGGLVGRALFAFTAPEASALLQSHTARRQAGETTSYEHALFRPNGERREVFVTGSPLIDKEGTYTGAFALVHDITERKAAERAIAQERDLLHTLLDGIPDMVYFKDTASRFVRINKSQARLLGTASPEEALGKSDDDYFAPDEAEWRRQDELRIMATSLPQVGKIERIEKPDAPPLWLSVTKIPRRSETGEIIGTFGVSRDITEIIETREALRDSEERYRALVETMDEGILLLDADGVCQFANPAVFSIIQRDNRPLVGHNVREFLAADQHGIIDAEGARRRKGLRGSYEVQFARPDGDTRDLWITATPRFDMAGSYIGSLVLVQDITERKRLLTQLVQEQKEETILTLAGGIAHDFNNILVGVLGSSTLLLESPALSGSDRELCEIIRTSSQRMSDLTNKLLAYARGGRYQPRPLDINAAISETLSLLKSSIPLSIELERDFAAELWLVEGDPGQLHQVLLNLVINAYEAMPEGGKLAVHTQNVARPYGWRCPRHGEHPPGDYVHITVADSGQGMDAATLARIFEPFFTTKLQGRGLGLAAVQGIIRSHGGCIDVESRPGGGAKFSLYLPRTEMQLQDATASADSRLAGKETILFVDDEEVVREMARRALQRRGYKVLMAATGTDGLEQYLAHAAEIALVVFDMQMPQMGGGALLARLKALNPRLKTIASSGFNEALVLSEISDESPSGFLQKPYSPRELQSMVREVLDRPE